MLFLRYVCSHNSRPEFESYASALPSLIANSSQVNLRYMKDVETYLEQDIRMDMDEFNKMDKTIFEDYIKVGKKADSISTLLKFLRR